MGPLWDQQPGLGPQANGSPLTSQSGECLNDLAPSATDGSQLDIWDRNGNANQA